jgi:hypothetical protein
MTTLLQMINAFAMKNGNLNYHAKINAIMNKCCSHAKQKFTYPVKRSYTQTKYTHRSIQSRQITFNEICNLPHSIFKVSY